MNYIQQNARDLVIGLREMKWKAFEQQLLTPPDEDNFDCAPPSDLPHLAETDEQMLQRLKEETRLLDSARRNKSWATPTCECADCLFEGEDTSHLPQQIRNRIAYIAGEFHV